MISIKEKLRSIILSMAEKKEKNINDDTDLFEEGILDSLNVIILVTSVQNEFDIELAYEDLIPQNLTNLLTIESLIMKYVNITSNENIKK